MTVETQLGHRPVVRRLDCSTAGRPVRPCERTLAGRPRDAGRPGDRRAFRSLYDRAEAQVRELIAELAGAGTESGTDEQRVGDLYASFLDEEQVARRGVQPLLEELGLIDDAAGRASWPPWSARSSAAAWAAASACTSTPTQEFRALPAAPHPVRSRAARRVVLPG